MLRIHYVLNVNTGKTLDTEALLNSMSEQEKHVLRRELAGRRTIKYTCPVCDQQVYLAGTVKKVYHFKHFPNYGECLLKDNQLYTKEDIKKIIYNGAKESVRHKELKQWLGDFLKSLEPNGEFSECNIEKRITSAKGKKHWRQPDVSCSYNDKRLVFELQLNSTFIDVILGREEFYANEQTYICWLFDSFNPHVTKFGERDIFWPNKSNAFAITEETMRLSEKKGELMIECHYIEPFIDDTVIKDNWISQILPFSELSLKKGYYKPFYFDSDLAREKLKMHTLATDFLSYFFGTRIKLEPSEQKENDDIFMVKFKNRLQKKNLPNTITTSFINILDALYFLKTGETDNLNHKFRNIKQFTNQILHLYPKHGVIFCMAIKKFLPNFKSEELGSKLKRKVQDFWQEFKTAEEQGKSTKQDKSYNPILTLLFPELKEYLT